MFARPTLSALREGVVEVGVAACPKGVASAWPPGAHTRTQVDVRIVVVVIVVVVVYYYYIGQEVHALAPTRDGQMCSKCKLASAFTIAAHTTRMEVKIGIMVAIARRLVAARVSMNAPKDRPTDQSVHARANSLSRSQSGGRLRCCSSNESRPRFERGLEGSATTRGSLDTTGTS